MLLNNSGADLSALIRQAAVLSLKEILLARKTENIPDNVNVLVGMNHFEEAFGSVRPSVSDQDRRKYEQLRTVFDVVR